VRFQMEIVFSERENENAENVTSDCLLASRVSHIIQRDLRKTSSYTSTDCNGPSRPALHRPCVGGGATE